MTRQYKFLSREQIEYDWLFAYKGVMNGVLVQYSPTIRNEPCVVTAKKYKQKLMQYTKFPSAFTLKSLPTKLITIICTD